MPENRLPSIDDFADAEHCVLEDITIEHPAIAPSSGLSDTRIARQVVTAVEIEDRLRGRKTAVRIFAEGWVDLELSSRGSESAAYRVDLRYLDPSPLMKRYYPARLYKASAFLAGISSILGLAALAGWQAQYFAAAAILGALATLSAFAVAYYRTHERIAFKTRHGRADTIRFWAGLGTIRRFRKLLPPLTQAIFEAVESMREESAVYLRAEMREHYRLRGEGVLTDQECADSTGRILGKFDDPK